MLSLLVSPARAAMVLQLPLSRILGPLGQQWPNVLLLGESKWKYIYNNKLCGVLKWCYSTDTQCVCGHFRVLSLRYAPWHSAKGRRGVNMLSVCAL